MGCSSSKDVQNGPEPEVATKVLSAPAGTLALAGVVSQWLVAETSMFICRSRVTSPPRRQEW